MSGSLEVLTKHGELVLVPLTGEPRADAVLRRLAAKGGRVTELYPDDPEADARTALQEGA